MTEKQITAFIRFVDLVQSMYIRVSIYLYIVAVWLAAITIYLIWSR